MIRTEERVNNMPAIKLARGQEIQGGRKKTHPGRKSHGVKNNVHPLRGTEVE